LERRRYLFSLKPHFAEALLSGNKTVELRRRSPALAAGDEIYVYASGTKRAILGLVLCRDIVVAHIDELWRRFSKGAGVSEAQFDEYFAGRTVGSAIVVASGRPFVKPWTLVSIRERLPQFRPPQSHMLVTGDLAKRLVRRARYSRR
jgi:predicted transcriptional regulator